jgi:hypothetical protein
MRVYLESLAQTAGFDPLVVENWYSVSIMNFGQQHKVSFFPLLSSLL